MPSILEDPSSTIPPPASHIKSLKTKSINPVKTTLKSGTPVTLHPITTGPSAVPRSLVQLLHREFSAEIERGCTYPMEEVMSFERFAEYWFGTFAVVATLDSQEGREGEGLLAGGEKRDWEKDCVGTFYIKPNYPGMFFFLLPGTTWYSNWDCKLTWLARPLFACLQCRLPNDRGSKKPGRGHGNGQCILAICSVIGSSLPTFFQLH